MIIFAETVSPLMTNINVDLSLGLSSLYKTQYRVFITWKTAVSHFKNNPKAGKNRKKASGTCIIVLLVCNQAIHIIRPGHKI